MELRESKRYKGYFSDKEGNIYSNRRGKLVLKTLRKDKDGYLITSVIDDTKGFETTARAHRIVVDCWIDNPEDKPVVNHINNTKDDNRVDNLEWATISENTAHAYKGGWVTNPHSTSVSLYIRDKLICVYPTFKQCAQSLNIGRDYIRILIKTNRKLCDFMEFRLEGKEETPYQLSINIILKYLNPIINQTTKELYCNIKEMSQKTNTTVSTSQYYLKRGYNKKNEKIEKITKEEFLIASGYLK